MLATLRFQVGLLALMQALLLTNNVTLTAVNGLAGLQLADNKLLATLPVTGYVLGGAVWSMPAAVFMRRFGRRAGYTVGSIAAMGGAVLAWHAMTLGSLALLCAATFASGLYNAFGASLRFAAADVSDAYRPGFRARAISLVLAGGIAGGVIGPEISKWSREWLPTQFAGTYLTLVGFAFASLLLAQLLRLGAPAQAGAAAAGAAARPLGDILRQPACWVAILCAALSYGVMNLLMVATPLAMQVCSHPYASAALVIEWHVVGMFAPGLATGSLIGRFGVLPVIAAGCALMLGCVAIALSGIELMHFVSALVLLGIGWNFMYTGASTLLTSAYRPAEKNKVQGFMDLCVFTVMITSSASSGALLFVNGWSILNLLSLPFVLAVLGAVAWLAARNGWALGRVPARP
ncbi:MAG: MFS transporter [Burkholderiaceae bacterium]|nr:MFS transporter [Burkholderiaceae bacterium]